MLWTFPSTMINSISTKSQVSLSDTTIPAEETESLIHSDPPAWVPCPFHSALPHVGWMRALWFLGSSFKWDLHRLSQLYRNQEISFGFTPRTIPLLLSSWECRQSCGLSICVWPDRTKDHGQETHAPGAPWQQLQHLLTSDPRHRHPSTHSPGPGLEPRARVTPSPKCQPS